MVIGVLSLLLFLPHNVNLVTLPKDFFFRDRAYITQDCRIYDLSIIEYRFETSAEPPCWEIEDGVSVTVLGFASQLSASHK